MSEELLDAGVTQGAPEGASGKHVEDGVNSATDEHHGSGNEGHGGPDALQSCCRGFFNGQDYEWEDISYVMRCPTNTKHNHNTGNEDSRLALGLEVHLGDPAAQAAIADHKDGEG